MAALLPVQSQRDGDGWWRTRVKIQGQTPGSSRRPQESVSRNTALLVLKTSIRALLGKLTKYDAITQVTECHQTSH